MSAFWGNLIGAVTALVMALFLGIWIWVWNARHKAKYDALARLPMDDLREADTGGQP
jgi:cytochrome c oxidase cbb3-type subunit 4